LAQAQREYAASFGTDDLRTFTVSRKLALTERMLRNFDGAVALYESLARAAPAIKGLEDDRRADFDWEWVDLLYSAGRYARALSEVEEAEPRCSKSIGPDAEGCRLLLLRKGVILLRLGWVDRAAVAMPRIQAIARDERSPYVQTEALLLGLRLESAASGAGTVPPSFDKVRAFGESGDSVTIKPIFKAAALLALAESRLRGGDPVDAQRWAKKAIDLVPGEEPVDEDAPPLTGSMADIAAGLRAFAEAGADEVIVIPSPNTERAIRAFGEALALLSQ